MAYNECIEYICDRCGKTELIREYTGYDEPVDWLLDFEIGNSGEFDFCPKCKVELFEKFAEFATVHKKGKS